MNKYLVKSAFLFGLAPKLAGIAKNLFKDISKPKKDISEPERIEPIAKLAEDKDNKYLAKIEKSRAFQREAKTGRFEHFSMNHKSPDKE